MSQDNGNRHENVEFVGDVVCTEEDFEFAQATTCHGLSRFCNNWILIRRIIWFIIVMVSIGVMIFQLEKRTADFIQFEMKTNIKLEQEESLALPAITICNVNFYSNPDMNSTDRQLFGKVSTPLTLELIQILNETVSKYGEEVFKNKTAISNLEQTLISKADKFQQIENEILGNRTHQFVMSNWMEKVAWKLFSARHSTPIAFTDTSNFIWCKIGNTECKKEDFVIVHTESGPCYSFNVNSSMPFTQRRRGIQNGLLLIVDVREVDYSGFSLGLSYPLGAGLKIVLHEMGEHPDVQNAVAIPTGASSNIPVRKIIKTTVDEWPWNSCSDYSKRKCVRECEARQTVKWCSCRLWYEPNPDNTKECGVAYSSYCLFLKTILHALEQEDEFRDRSCTQSCQQSCSEVSFEFSISYNNLISAHALNSVKANMEASKLDATNSPLFDPKLLDAEYIRTNLVTAAIGYAELEQQVIESTPLQTASAFLSDIGGQLGLFAGISVITICELLEYPFIKLGLYVERRKQRNEGSHNDKQSTSQS